MRCLSLRTTCWKCPRFPASYHERPRGLRKGRLLTISKEYAEKEPKTATCTVLCATCRGSCKQPARAVVLRCLRYREWRISRAREG
jgi:hypothetical protein